MGICESKGNKNLDNKQELALEHKPIPLETAKKLSKSLCKIIIKELNKKGSGFFMIYKSLKLLITNYHVIDSYLINKDIEFELYNKKTINLTLNENRFIKLFEKPIDISIIEIKDSDGINQDIEYLNYDLNLEMGYSQYKELDAICIQYPFGKELSCASGKIKKINDFEFLHNIPTEPGSSGSPIILFNTLKVIGIHKYGNETKQLNCGTFIDLIFNEINYNLKKEKNKFNNGYNN